MNLRLIIYSFAAALILSSCGSNKKSEEKTIEPDTLITITQKQFVTDGMAFGMLLKMPFDEMVKCNGNIVAKSSGMAKISTSVSGLVQKINCTVGQKVSRGQVLFELTGNELIEIQQQFTETASQLKRLKSEYERMKALYTEKVSTEKELILAESEYKTIHARYSALKMKIQMMGLDMEKIEEGDFYTSFSIKSPINGYITQISLSIGQYADQQTKMAEIIDAGQLQIELKVFEKDVINLNPGQKISFSLLDNSSSKYPAVLQSIGKTVDTETKTIQCIATIDDLNSRNFVNNAYVEAQIITKTDTVAAVPNEALLKSEGESFLLKLVKVENEGYRLEKAGVKTGRISQGFVEILNPTESDKYMISGAYNILIK